MNNFSKEFPNLIGSYSNFTLSIFCFLNELMLPLSCQSPSLSLKAGANVKPFFLSNKIKINFFILFPKTLHLKRTIPNKPTIPHLICECKPTTFFLIQQTFSKGFLKKKSLFF